MGRHQLNIVRGEQHHSAKLTEDKVREIRRLHNERGLCIHCIAILHNIKYAIAWDAINYRTWKHVL